MKETDSLKDLPLFWQQRITKIRRESARHRIERNEAQAEVERLRAELAELKARTDAQ